MYLNEHFKNEPIFLKMNRVIRIMIVLLLTVGFPEVRPFKIRVYQKL